MIITNYFFKAYIADGKHLSFSVLCTTPEEAIEKAQKWSATNGKAEAIKVEIDLTSQQITETLL
jgi:hypothetical protein